MPPKRCKHGTLIDRTLWCHAWPGSAGQAPGASAEDWPEPATLVDDPLADWEWSAIASTLDRYEVPGFTGPAAAVSATALATDPRAKPMG